MADPAIMTANERWKSVSRTLFQLGTVLLSATILEVYRSVAVTVETLGWLLGVAMLMYSGWKVLILLDSET